MRKGFALFLGCKIPASLPQYESAARAVLGQLGASLSTLPEFGCCGYPLRNIDQKAFVLSSARNIALAEKQGLDLLTLCQCGYGTLRMADHLLKENGALLKETNSLLSREGLRYQGTTRIAHFLSVLFHDIGVETIRAQIRQPFVNLKVAPHYGCHALRPSRVMRFDHPASPRLFEQLVEVTGAQSVAWPLKSACCGGPLKGTDDTMSLDFAESKLEDAAQAGAHCVATACPYCQIQFDTVPHRMRFERGDIRVLPALLFAQLLGLALGLDRHILGMQLNQGDMAVIENAHGTAAAFA